MCSLLEKALDRGNGECRVRPLCRYEVGFDVAFAPDGTEDATIRIDSVDNVLCNDMYLCVDGTGEKEVIPANCKLVVTGVDAHWTDEEVEAIKKVFFDYKCTVV